MARFDTDIADVASIEIPHDQNVFSFHYAALSYGAKRIQYAYRLDGIDPEWIPAGFQRSVNYAYVPPGEYVFRVRASKYSGIWSDNQLAVRLRIHPPFWRTWWFLALAIIAVAGAVAAGVRVRVRRLKEIERLRARIARDLHDEIGSNLSSIAMRSDLLQRQSSIGERERQTLDDISSVALTTLNDMKDIVWLIRPGNDALDDLFLRMKDTAAAMLEGCQYTLDFPHGPQDRKVGLEWKQNVYLIYKEALANIARHSGASTVAIDVLVDAGHLSMVIRDDGTGFDPADVTPGNGLRNIRERAALLRGHLDIEAKPGAGTTLTLEAQIT
jgi:signal transduction histidine kinase